MSITADLIRGHTDAIILAQLTDGDSYGYKINKSIREASDNKYELKEATLYTAFRRLEQAGCISSYWGEGEAGARRRYYTITKHGSQVYRRHLEEWKDAMTLIDRLVTRGDFRGK